MPISPPVTPPAPLTYSVLDVLTDALIETGAVAPGEYPEAEVAQWSFRVFNDLIDSWQARKLYVWSYQYIIYTMKVKANPQTLGPSGTADFDTLGQPRPVKLESAAQLLNTTGTLVDLPINIRDHTWWALQQTKEITTNVVTDVFYDPTSPDGSLYLWPVPNQQNQIRLQFWQTVSQFTSIQDPIGGPGGPGTLPQGYRAALKYTLAEWLLPGLSRAAPPMLGEKALKARTAIGANNDKSPRIATQDFGMPRAGSRGSSSGDFNWFTGGRIGGRPE